MKNFYFITWVTHGSRVSERMEVYKVPKIKGVFLNLSEEIFIASIIREIVPNDHLKVLAFNICGDHVHLVIWIEEENLSKTVGKLKAVSAREFNILGGITVSRFSNKGTCPLVKNTESIYADGTQNHLWAQKSYKKFLETEKQLFAAINYVQENREKHQLPQSDKLEEIIKSFLINYENCSQKI